MADGAMPGGTVTFLFTDIESSSARWEADGAEMAAVLARHDELIGEAIAARGGVIFKHLGDGLCAAFSVASDALRAAVDAQRALRDEAWPGGRPVLVRMGLHTGAAQPSGADYHGPPVNRAARVMDAANGGQIVCSAAAAALCPDGDWVDHGLHELRGVGVERLLVVRLDGLDAQRPLRVAATALTTVPVDPTSFVGRTGDVDDLVAALARHAIVTLVGPGGIGKTRLAMETTRAAAPRYSGGVRWCDLAPTAGDEAMLAAVAAAVGARPQPTMGPVASIASRLDGNDVLVVLDNAEHVLTGVRELVTSLAGLEAVSLLITSREPLGLRPEQVWEVGPLDAPTAGVELFLDRARARDRRFDITEDETEVVAEICQRLDGLPLAIELAAARTRTMSVLSIARRIDDRFGLLGGPRRGDRHRTLRDTVHWSYDLLAPPEALLFERVSVFAGTFSLDMAERVCDRGGEADDPDVIDLLDALVDKSMLTVDTRGSETRYGLLETLRQFASERLEAGGEAELYRRRHGSAYRDLAVELAARERSPEEPEVWAAFEAEWDNLRAAQSHASATGDLETAAEIAISVGEFMAYGQHLEGFNWVDALLRVVEPGMAGYADLCGLAGAGAFIRGQTERVIEVTDAGLPADPANARCRSMGALARVWQGDRAATAAYIDSWRAAIRPSDDPWDHLLLHLFASMSDHTAAASPSADAAMEAARRLSSPTAIAAAHWARHFALVRTDPVGAMVALQTMSAVAARSSERHICVLNARMILADVASVHSDVNTALRHCRDALRTTADGHHVAGVYSALENIALVLARSGTPSVAAEILGHIETSGHGTPRQRRRIEELLRTDADQADLSAARVAGAALTSQEAQRLAIQTIDDLLGG